MISMAAWVSRSEGLTAARWKVLCVALLTLVFIVPWGAAHADTTASPLRTWKTVAELSPELRARVQAQE